MAKPQKTLFQKAIEHIVFFRHRKQPAHSSARQPPARTSQQESLSTSKKKKLETLYDRLMADKDFLISGKLQFLNFQQVRSALGGRWHNVKNIIYSLTDEVIGKYTDEDDVFFRYKEDYYIVIFANASLEEGRLKCALIATEIKKLLSEEQKTNEKMRDIRDIDLSHVVKLVSSVDIVNKDNRMRTVSEDFDAKQEKTITDSDIEALINQSTAVTIEAPAGTERPEKPVAPAEKNSGLALDFFYLPVWSRANSDNAAYITMASKRAAKDPVASYYSLFTGTGIAQAATLDKRIMRKAIENFASPQWGKAPYFLGVPVHFSTLQNSQTFSDYVIECQKLLPEHRAALSFLINEIPEGSTNITLQQVISPLKNYAVRITVCLKTPSVKEIPVFVNCGATAIALSIHSSNKYSEQDYINRMPAFVSHVHQYRLKAKLILNVKSDGLLQSGLRSGFDFIGGSGFEAPIESPTKILKFANI